MSHRKFATCASWTEMIRDRSARGWERRRCGGKCERSFSLSTKFIPAASPIVDAGVSSSLPASSEKKSSKENYHWGWHLWEMNPLYGASHWGTKKVAGLIAEFSICIFQQKTNPDTQTCAPGWPPLQVQCPMVLTPCWGFANFCQFEASSVSFPVQNRGIKPWGQQLFFNSHSVQILCFARAAVLIQPCGTHAEMAGCANCASSVHVAAPVYPGAEAGLSDCHTVNTGPQQLPTILPWDCGEVFCRDWCMPGRYCSWSFFPGCESTRSGPHEAAGWDRREKGDHLLPPASGFLTLCTPGLMFTSSIPPLSNFGIHPALVKAGDVQEPQHVGVLKSPSVQTTSSGSLCSPQSRYLIHVFIGKISRLRPASSQMPTRRAGFFSWFYYLSSLLPICFHLTSINSGQFLCCIRPCLGLRWEILKGKWV